MNIYDTPIGELTRRQIVQHDLKIAIIVFLIIVLIWGLVALYKHNSKH